MSSSALEVVRTTTGMRFRFSSCLISASTSRPSFLGRFRSNRIKSGLGLSAYGPSLCRKASAAIPSCTTWSMLRTFASLRASRVRRTSAGLSSTNKMSIGRTGFIIIPSFIRNGEMESGTCSRFRLHPHAATMALHNLFADRQANARAGIFLTAMQALKNNENPVKILRSDADAVIAYAELPSTVLPSSGNVNAWRFLRPPELDGIAEQILEKLRQLRLVGEKCRERIVRDLGPALGCGSLEILLRDLKNLLTGDRSKWITAHADAREGQQVVDQGLHPRRALDDEGDEFVRIRVQFSVVTPGQQLRETAHGPQWFLQIVRGDISKLFEFLVAALKLLGIA